MKFLNHNLFTGDITVNGTTTLSTATGVTRATGDNTTHLATTAFVKAQDYATNTALGNYVPLSRTLTINNVTYDLSANRSWTIGTSDYTSVVKHAVKAGVAITKGQAIYVTSADGTNMIVGLASNATEATSSKTMGLAETTVAINGFTNVVTEGLLAGLNTVGANAGDPVWLGTGGNLIYGLLNKPYAPAHLVFIGIVTRVNANNGEIFVKVQNGFELKEIHDVDLITVVPVNGEILGFNGTLWVNKTIAGWLGYTPANASGTTNYLSKFTGTTTLGNSQIFDNGTNVGIGTTSPAYKLDVNGNTRSENVIIGTDATYGNPYRTVAFGSTGDGNNRILASTTAADGMYFMAATGQGFNFRPNGGTANLVVINSSGNVGIGTASPLFNLQVGANAGTVAATTIRLQNSYLDTNGSYGFNIDAVDNGVSGHDLRFLGRTSPTSSFSELVRIKNSGNVGIGTNSPQYSLDVAGAIRSYSTIVRRDTSSGNAVTNYFESANNYWATGMPASSYSYVITDNNYGIDKVFVTQGTSWGVGIGTDTPSEKLHVVGRARITTIDNGTGDFATISGTGVITRRTAAQVLSDIGAQPSGSYLTAESDTLQSVTSRGSSTNTDMSIGGTGGDRGLAIYHGDYGRIRFYQGSTNISTIHSFATDWQSGNVLVSGGALNLTGNTGVTIGGWNDPDAVFRGGGSTYFRNNVGIGSTTPDSKLEVNGRVSIRGANELYFGQSTSLIGSWTTRMYASGSTHKFNANEFIFNNEGYGSTEFVRITSTGNVGINIASPVASLDNQGSAGTYRQRGFTTMVTNTLAAAGTQAKRFEIARASIDYNDWNSVGPIEVELYEKYFSRGLKKKYVIYYGYVSSSGCNLVEMTGAGENGFMVSIGAEVVISGDNRYIPIYVDVRNYSQVTAVVKTNRGLSASNPPGIADIWMNSMPTGVDISDFTADSTVYVGNLINGNSTFSTGNVGIGTTAPGAKLDIVSTGAGSEGLRVDGAAGGFAFVVKGGSDYTSHIRAGATIGVNYVTTPPSNGLIVEGNVGIGTTAPPIKLYVGTVLTGTNGNGTYASDAIAVNSSDSITIGPDRRADWGLDATTAISTTFRSKLNIWSDNEDHITFGGASTHLVSAWESFKIWINNDSADAGTLHLYHTSSKTEFVRLAGSGNSWINGGNVGIGTTSPGTKLDVNGVITATGGNSTNWNTAYGWGNHASAGYAAASSLANYLPLTGGTMSGTLNFQQPVGLGFANGQYIKDNSAGGLIIYSGAAVNINGTSITVSNNTTVAGWLGVTGIVSANARKLSLGILDLNSGVTPAQFKIKTTIPWNYGGSDFTVNIKGFRYGTGQMVSLSIGWHYYNNEFYNRNAISNGAWAPTISLAKSPDGYVIIHIPGPDYWPKLYVESVYSSNSTDSYTSGWSWSDADLSDCTLTQTVPYKDLATNISGNAATATNVAYSGLTGTVPTWNQNTTGNAATSSTFSTSWTNYKGVTDNAVAGQLMWKNYGNNHTIFDASNSTSPTGSAVNNTNSAIAWAATYPTLMGWNGVSTYGVRVDSARLADTAGALTSMNISQFSNNSGYLTAESDTLATVTGRGATTTTPIIVTASEGREVAVYMASSYTTDDLVSGHEYGWYADHWRLGMTRSSAAAGADFVIQWNGARRLSLTNGGNLTVTGTISATNFSGSSSGTNTGDQTNITGNAGTATALQTGRTLTVGATGKTFDGTGNVSWTLGEIGAQAAGSYVIANGTSAGDIDADWGQSFKTFDPVPSGTPPLASPNIRTINVGDSYSRRTQLAFDYSSDVAYFRRRTEAGWFTWREFIHSGNIGTQSVNYATTAGSAPNAGNINPFYNVTAGVGNGLRFWGGDDNYKISMGVGGLYQYGPVTDYSIKTQMDVGSPGRGFTWGNNGVTPVAALNATSGNMQIAGTFTASNFSGSSSGTNTGDQTNISGNAATASAVAWDNITSKPSWMINASLIGSHSNADSQVNSGFYENGGGGSNWPAGSATWYNSINVRHSNQGNYHGFQVAMSYYDNLLWFRSYQGSGTFQSWVYAISSANIGSQSVLYAATAGALTSMNISQFTNNSGYITGYTETNTFLGDGGSADTHPGTDRLIFTGQLSLGAPVLGMPSTDNSNAIININRHPGEYNSQLGFSSDGSMYYRSFSTVAINNTLAWRQVWDSGNLTNLNQLTNGPGYITGNQTITLSGDVSGSGTTSIVVTVNNIDGWGFVNTGNNSPTDADSINSNGISYYTAGVTNFSGNATDGALYSQRYSDNWQHQIAGDYRSGMIAVRGKNNGTWTSWKTVLDSSNFTSWAVSTTYNSSLNSDSRNSRGVTRLYRRDDDSDFSVQHHWTGSYWWLRGYNGDTFHAEVRVAYADSAGSAGSASSATSATQVVTIQDDPPTGVNGKLWWESDTGKLKVYYGTSSAWVDATPVPDMSLYYAKAGGPISGDVTIQQTLTVVGNTLIQGTLTETSDISLKENILPLESSLDKVMKLNGVSFNKKATPNVKEIGFIAQEVEAVIPDLVTETNEGIKTVSYSRVTAVLVETIKEQQAQINTQQSQIEELKNMVNMLAEKLNSL